MRKLASVQVIESITEIPNSDYLELAQVLGWQVVVKKCEFKVGDKCVYFEIDSILPKDQPWADFMKDRGYRLRTIKLRGQLSQGLALPLNIIPSGELNSLTVQVGDDLTEYLGIVKYEPQLHVCLSGDQAGLFPSVIPKTDEDRIQSIWYKLKRQLIGRKLVASLKLDGTSATYWRKWDGELAICSRNFQMKAEQAGGKSNAYVAMAAKYELDKYLPRGYYIQGEIVGPGIQGNKLGLTQLEFRPFTLGTVNEEVNTSLRLAPDVMAGFVEAFLPSLTPAEFIWRGDFTEATELKDLLAMAEGKYPGTSNEREGLVFRTCDGSDPSFSFKVISNKFLLKGGD